MPRGNNAGGGESFRPLFDLEDGRVFESNLTMRLHILGDLHLEFGTAEVPVTDADVVVVTHHAPSPRSEAPYHANSPLKPAFASDLDELVEESHVPLWIHGHTHYNVDYVIGSTRVLTYQRGYPDQLCQDFDPSLVVEV